MTTPPHQPDHQGRLGYAQLGTPAFAPASPEHEGKPHFITPQPKPKKNQARFTVPLVVIALVLAGYFLLRGDAQKVDAGECIALAGGGSDPTVSIVTCEDARATYKVAKKLDDSEGACPHGDYIEYWERTRRTGGLKLCLMANAREGDCFVVTGSGQDTDLVRSPCSQGGAIRVVKVHDGVSDGKLCGNPDAAWTYSEPPATYCLGKPDAAA
ncbi:LppU/SCO3897 family protein [Allokutzneria albata]|uniref:Uncharacterized protein n=1 Tax=Allokutzneria albata TaxID=211114 RepID=A0A1H0AVC0_ALLAB|nr:hypothetical protein [Allokutzneria albata]SDN37438.1 hypothetical protein SAMN04489726_6304 [Allokutzneria albata]